MMTQTRYEDISFVHSKKFVLLRLPLSVVLIIVSMIGMLDKTRRCSSTVTSREKMALKSGSSKQGKQDLASVAANMVAAPSCFSPFLSTYGQVKKPSKFGEIFPANFILSQARVPSSIGRAKQIPMQSKDGFLMISEHYKMQAGLSF